jgi:hypothetical protein
VCQFLLENFRDPFWFSGSLGWVGFHAPGAYVHILLVLALIVLLIQLFTGRRPVV